MEDFLDELGGDPVELEPTKDTQTENKVVEEKKVEEVKTQEAKEGELIPSKEPEVEAIPLEQAVVIEKPVSNKPEDLLNFAQTVRKEIVSSLVKPALDGDYSAIELLNTTLNNMDSSSIGQMRVKVDEDKNDISSQALAIVNELRKDPKQSLSYEDTETKVDHTPAIDTTKLDQIETKPTELQQGLHIETAQEFISRTNMLEKEDS